MRHVVRKATPPTCGALVALGVAHFSSGCGLDGRDLPLNPALACASPATSTCADVYGSQGDCGGIVLACSADGYWPDASSCAPSDLMGRCGEPVTSPPGAPPGSDGSGGDGQSTEPSTRVEPALPGDDEPIAGSSPQPPCRTLDQVFEQLSLDVAALDVEDRPFARYLSLSNRRDGGACDAELSLDRQALTEMIHLVSLAAAVAPPVAIDAEQTLYRLDLRDYRWDRSVVVGGTSFADAWEAIIANSPYAVPFVGEAADALVAATRTRVPWLYSDALIDAASVGDLYYALIDVSPGGLLEDVLQSDLGIDPQTALADEEVVMAGTTRSMVSSADRWMVRYDLGVRNGYYFQIADLAEDDSMFESPLGPPSNGFAAVFSLPNGLWGYLVADAAQRIGIESEVAVGASQNDFLRPAVSCLACHAQGLLPVADEVRDLVVGSIGVDPATVATVQEAYPTNAELARILADDNELRTRTLESLSLPTGATDPVAQVFQRFDGDLDLADAARDLGVSSRDLLAALGRLDPILAVLDGLVLDRDDFTSVYAASLCTLHAEARNRPAPDACR